MYLKDLTATFATALGVPPIKVVEHHRSIRDGTEAIASTLSRPISNACNKYSTANRDPTVSI